MAPVAEDFVGEQLLEAVGLRRLIRLQMLGNCQIRATLGSVDIALRGDVASVRFPVLLAVAVAAAAGCRGKRHSAIR
ncbi:hypothetical protein GGR62_003050 [Xanthomonas campestris]|nr:hypothetical protein [Xanthomonas sp. 3075]